MPMILCPYCLRVFASERDLEQHQRAKRVVSPAHGAALPGAVASNDTTAEPTEGA